MRLARTIALARLALLAELIWSLAWPASGLLLLYAALSLFDVWSALPESLHRAGAALFVALMVYALAHKAARHTLPGEGAAMRRLEAQNALHHRPLDVPGQAIAGGAGDAISEALWNAHLARTETRLKSLRGFWPQLGLESADPRALRFLVFLLLAAGFVVAGPDAGNRLAHGFVLTSAREPLPPPRLDVWIEPPAYTKLPTVFVTHGAQGLSQIPPMIGPVPAGSKLSLRIQGTVVRPRLRITEAGEHSRRVKLGGAVNDVLAGDTVIKAPAAVNIATGLRSLASFKIKVLPDLPPAIAFAGPIKQTARGALRIGYQTADDYGIADIALQMKLVSDGPAADAAPVSLPLPAPAGPGKAQLHANLDLTANPWAGLPVTLTLHAKDGAGQAGVSKSQTITLPERAFNDPLARLLIAARRNLMRDPTTAGGAMAVLNQVSGTLVESGKPPALVLALRAAFWALRDDMESEEGRLHAGALMWSVAVALEDGAAGEARAQLDEAKSALADALKNGASQTELAQRMDALRQALARYLAALEAKMAGQPEQGAKPVDPSLHGITAQDFARLMDTLDNLTKTGARGEAQDLLSALDDILQNLTTGGGGAQSAGDAQGAQALEQLGDLIGKERALMDETYRDAQAAEDGAASKKDPKGLAARQEQLRKELGQVMTSLGADAGKIPQGLGGAERAMAGARDALSGGRRREGVDKQGEALDQLRAGAREIAQAMARASAGGSRGPSGMPASDPFGRPNAGLPDQGDSVKVPSRSEAQRARDILEEIRRRAAERGRPQQELDYLDRLLQRF